MKKRCVYSVAFVMAMCLFSAADRVDAAECELDRRPISTCFIMQENKNIYDSKHLRIYNGFMTLGSNPKEIMNFRNPVAPPLVANDFEFSMKMNGQIGMPVYTGWQINDFDRHYRQDDMILRTTLTLAPAEPVFLSLGMFYNRGEQDREYELSFEMGGMMGAPRPRAWDNDGPAVSTPTTPAFDAEKKIFSASTPQGGVFCRTELPDPVFENGLLKSKLTALATEPVMFYFVCAVEEEKEAKALLAQYEDTGKFVKAARDDLREKFKAMFKSLPYLITNNRNLRTFYDRSLLSLDAARWDNGDAFAVTPFYAAGGIDGRALAAHLWEYSYAAPLLIMADPAAARRQIRFFFNMGIDDHRAFEPQKAYGIGQRLAFNDYAIVKLARDYVALTGDWEMLTERVIGKPVIDHIVDIAGRQTSTLDMPGLIDYGPTGQLLGLRNAPYEHYAPSPNAERVEIFRIAADMLDLLERRESEADMLRKKADHLEELINDKLWNEDAGWYDVIDTAGGRHTVWSAQVFDLLGTSVPSGARADRMVAHLNDNEFLYPYGLHSLSRKDPGFDEGDVAWGGPGSFIGEAPQLITNLYKTGYTELGEDILERILWWGNRFPYYPEAVRADQMEFDNEGRANSVAGAAGALALIEGVFGLEVSLRGEVSINPVPLEFVDKLELHGLMARRIRIDLKMKPGACEVYVNFNKVMDAPLGERTVVIHGTDIQFPDPFDAPCHQPETIRQNIRKRIDGN